MRHNIQDSDEIETNYLNTTTLPIALPKIETVLYLKTTLTY